MRVPFVVYADFESRVKPLDTCQPKTNESYTNKTQKHIPISFCIYVKCFDDNIYTPHTVTFTAENEDDDVGQIFVNKLEEVIKQIYNQTKFAKEIIYTKKTRKILFQLLFDIFVKVNRRRPSKRSLSLNG